MKTLVIHPKDASTEMLGDVYVNRYYTVISDPNISKDELREAIREHDRIILLGHGLPNGLINPNAMKTFPNIESLYLVDDSFADLLKQKETISVWCFSDQFFARHHIPGFHTGMIISETKEAHYMLGRCTLSAKQLADNMIRFSKVLGECIEMPAPAMKKYVLSHYLGDDEITRYNRQNILVLE